MSATGIDEAKLEAFMGQAVTDMGAIISAPLMVIGEKLGLYKAMAGAGPLTSAGGGGALRRGRALASASGCATRRPAATSTYDPGERPLHAARTSTRWRSPTRTARSTSSACMTRSRRCTPTRTRSSRRSAAARAWAGTSTTTACSAAPSASSGPATARTSSREWIPALEGVQEKLERGAKVADVGCGHGASTIIMAEAFPNSEFFGFDYHDASIERARDAAARPGVGDRITFEVASAKDYPGRAATTSCACSTACTTWATRSAPRPTSARRSTPTAHG